jgi:hypothetical protein
MSTTKLTGFIDTVSLDVKEKGSSKTRTVVIKVAREFDESVSTMLGGDSAKALHSLRNGGMDKVYFKTDTVDCSAEFVGATDRVKVSALRGRQAVCAAGDGDYEPTVQLTFECAYSDDAWLFFGRHVGEIIEVTLVERQIELPAMRVA